MIAGVISSTGKCAAPLTVDHAGFEALTEGQRNQYGFWPCEFVHGPEPVEPEIYCCNGISRRKDRLRAHFRPSSDSGMIERHNAIMSELSGFTDVLISRLESMEVEVALSSVAEAIELVCAEVNALYNPPSPEEAGLSSSRRQSGQMAMSGETCVAAAVVASDMRMVKPLRPVGGTGCTLTPAMRARGGWASSGDTEPLDCRAVVNDSTRSAGPSTSMSTPRVSLSTKPARLRAAARR